MSSSTTSPTGGRVANLSVATDESYFNKSGEKVDQTEWHRVVTFQDGLIDMLERHATKGRLISVEGKLRTRRWKKDGEDSWRYSTEILVVPGNRVQFYDKPNRANGNGAQAAAETAPRTAGTCRPAVLRRRSTIPASRFPSRPVSPLPPNSGGRFGGRPFFAVCPESPSRWARRADAAAVIVPSAGGGGKRRTGKPFRREGGSP